MWNAAIRQYVAAEIRNLVARCGREMIGSGRVGDNEKRHGNGAIRSRMSAATKAQSDEQSRQR